MQETAFGSWLLAISENQSTMPAMSRRSRIVGITILPLLHLLFCGATTLGLNPGLGWEWFWVVFLDLPIVMVLPFIHWSPFWLTVLGTVWWGLLGWLLSMLVRVGAYLVSRMRRLP